LAYSYGKGGTFLQLLQKIRSIARFLKPMQIPLHSAYTCFFLILSLFPGLLLLLGLLRYTDLGPRELMGLLETVIPESLLPTVQALIENSYRHSSGTVVTVSVLGTLYSASRGMFGILGGLNAIAPPPREHGYLKRRGISILYNISFLLALLGFLVAYLGGLALLDFLWMTTDPFLMALLNRVDFGMILLLILQTGLFTAMYALLPGRRSSLRICLPGAAMASVLWLVFSWLFSLYVEHFAAYTNIYGSIYALALGMLWLYFCISIFFYGAAWNQYRNRKD
jgi:membrane protein